MAVLNPNDIVWIAGMIVYGVVNMVVEICGVSRNVVSYAQDAPPLIVQIVIQTLFRDHRVPCVLPRLVQVAVLRLVWNAIDYAVSSVLAHAKTVG